MKSDSKQTQQPCNIGGVGSSNPEPKIGVGAYCKCGKIIYVCTDDCYKHRGGKKEVDWYFDAGCRIGRVTRSEVNNLFGCDCAG